jgi:transcriptional regulator with XRE-family HTH domain
MTSRPGLADARKRAGFNQEAFAEEVGVTKHTISQWETGATGINSRRRPAIAAALGISLAELDGLVKGEPLDGESALGPLDAPDLPAEFAPRDHVALATPGDQEPGWLINPDRIPRRPYTVVPIPATGLILSAEHGESGLARTRRIIGQLTPIIRIAAGPQADVPTGRHAPATAAQPGRRSASGRADLR